ncbi:MULTISPECIES: TIGR03905 family TSCPD domain-containing protein [Caproicibacterium]|uniref:ribonucleoside-diphosphate reductase n=1 Tax=Caproicibacterium argilliputei TaxID=3030016 RepID=A0AA97H330_9FIRM|nr:TIGR03905 family TSCPD domain-containing protein [Caproicibacterium argilliputei]WOC33390.1 TIGR03905 family TSCPD domain-containing protein [Caproicibacterium argilliputei]
MEEYRYKTKGTCSREIRLQLDGDVVQNVQVIGGCDGNLKGISALVKGMKADEVIRRCSGIRCGSKSTSCPDQLAQALREALHR